MRTTSYSRVHTTVRLDRDEEWVTTTRDEKNFSFFVTQIFWDGGPWATISGPAHTTKGERGYVDRTSHRELKELPDSIHRELLQSRAAELRKLNEKESER